MKYLFILILGLLSCNSTQPVASIGVQSKVTGGITEQPLIQIINEIQICSFNIQFLGHFKNRDNKKLSEILHPYDIVVIQELVAPVEDGVFPNEVQYSADKESADFHKEMLEQGYSFWMSEEDTGPTKNHVNSTASEWWITYYRPEVVMPDTINNAYGFLDSNLVENASYERVPYAFPFVSPIGSSFSLISVHLKPGGSKADQTRREEELTAITQWISGEMNENKDFYILGDFNIKNQAELDQLISNLRISDSIQMMSLNNECFSTNTKFYELESKGKPYDHVFYTQYSQEDILDSSFVVVDLMESVRTFYSDSIPFPFSPYEHNSFRTSFSDHMPITFTIRENNDTD